MGAVVSCIQSVFQAIGSCIMAVIHAIGSIIMAIVNGIITIFDVIIGCLTCQGFSGRRRRTRHTTSAV